jgi:thioredoxin 1
MSKKGYIFMVGIICLLALLLITQMSIAVEKPIDVPVKGMVTMVDLGAGECVPCKMMAPILVKMERQYAGKAAVVFLDVWRDQAPARRFGISTIPTQIFFDKEGKEVYRHVGFLSEKDIVNRFTNMGVK